MYCDYFQHLINFHLAHSEVATNDKHVVQCQNFEILCNVSLVR